MLTLYSPPASIEAPDFGSFFNGTRFDNEAYSKAETEYIEKLQAWAKRLGPSSKIAGELVSMPYADGAALYIIVQSSGKHGIMTVPVGDAWRDPYFEQTVTVKYLTDYVKRDREFRKRWANRTA